MNKKKKKRVCQFSVSVHSFSSDHPIIIVRIQKQVTVLSSHEIAIAERPP
jgi:hypothetical protein